MKILVTGGSGYIGSTMVPLLLAQGHDVTVFDNFMYKQHSLGQVCYEKNFHVVRGDIRIESQIKPLVAKADVVLPLAALVGAPLCTQDSFTAASVNHDATVSVFKMLSKDQRVLMPTTNSAYGSGDKNNFCTEESPLRPVSQYAEEKVKVEQELLQHENAISFRLATVFGMSPRMRTDLLVNDFVYRAVFDRAVLLFESHFKRNYIHVRDVAKAFMHGMDNFDTMKGQIFNVGLSTANISKAELCEKIKQHIPGFTFVEAPVGKDPDQRNYIVSNDKLEATGYMPDNSIDDGILELMKGYTMIKNSIYGNI